MTGAAAGARGPCPSLGPGSLRFPLDMPAGPAGYSAPFWGRELTALVPLTWGHRAGSRRGCGPIGALSLARLRKANFYLLVSTARQRALHV
jgi:hypothetical protein